MWGKIVLGALGAGAVFGAIGTRKLTKATDKVMNKVKPKKNKVTILEVELDDDEDVSDLAFLVVKGVRSGTSKNIVDTVHIDPVEFEELANENRINQD